MQWEPRIFCVHVDHSLHSCSAGYVKVQIPGLSFETTALAVNPQCGTGPSDPSDRCLFLRWECKWPQMYVSV
jgi:hypothetical protein